MGNEWINVGHFLSAKQPQVFDVFARLSEYRAIHRALSTQAEVKLIPIEVKPELKDERLLVFKHKQGHQLILPVDTCAAWLGELMRCLD
jgi:hypothetical protein